MAYSSEKIKEVIEKIDKGEYILPAIQREFVWRSEQIEKLFDSIMRGYPINSFLYWKVDSNTLNNFDFYKFLKNYNQFNGGHNEKLTEEEKINKQNYISILDGQQRLTSLYIALKGTYSYKESRTRYDNKDNYPSRELYLNIAKKSDDIEMEYEFKFLTLKEAAEHTIDKHWFKVKDILEHSSIGTLIMRIPRLMQNFNVEKQEFAMSTISNLYNQICENSNINFFLEQEQNQDKVLDIFIRTNSGGTKLSYSDLLLSMATSQWQNGTNAREIVINAVNEINGIGAGFNVDKDFILKSCLLLTGKEIAFRIENFTKSKMNKIEENWENIFNSLKITFRLVSNFGYSRENLNSNNALIPIVFYIFKNKFNITYLEQKTKYAKDKQNIKKWLVLSLMKKAFSGQPDNILLPIRNIIEGSQEFPMVEIIENFRGHTKTLIFSDDDIENLVTSKYGENTTFSVLSLFYPNLDFQNRFHIDHIHPKNPKKSELKKLNFNKEQIERLFKLINLLPNLQLIDSTVNKEKQNKPFKSWLEENNNLDISNYKERNYIPIDESLELINFENFFNKRKFLLTEKLKELLQ